jgi:hypothetical protein
MHTYFLNGLLPFFFFFIRFRSIAIQATTTCALAIVYMLHSFAQLAGEVSRGINFIVSALASARHRFKVPWQLNITMLALGAHNHRFTGPVSFMPVYWGILLLHQLLFYQSILFIFT